MRDEESLIDWREIDTVLLDMDGTLLDLAFDNYFWLELVPEVYGSHYGLEADNARADLYARYERVAGSLPWYCLDHWTAELGLEIRELKWRHRHLIGFLPGAIDALRRLRAAGKRLVIVTNAHRGTLAIKLHQTRLDRFVDAVVCAHDFGTVKEDPAFWQAFSGVHRMRPHRTAFLEDSLPVLRTARAFGLRHTLAIRRPDSRKPPRTIDEMPAIDGPSDLQLPS